MTKEASSIASCALAILVGGLVPRPVLFAQGQPPAAPAEAPVAIIPIAKPVFSFELGHATLKPNPALTINYTVASTLPIASKAVNQKLRFTVEESGLREVTDSGGRTGGQQGTFTHYLTINTGKYKTLDQLKSIVADVFRRFLATGASVAPNTDLGKIGDARYGGELHFVVEGPDVLRCE